MDFSKIEWPATLFVTGIGTDVGKSFVTGWLAKGMTEAGMDCITQKMIQTGNTGMSEDIERHRNIMGIDLLPEDIDHTTSPVIFTYPASPHLAAKIDGKTIDFKKIDNATAILNKKHAHVIIEGAGGLMVPLEGHYLTADFLKERRIPVVVSVTGQLGSINHALLTFQMLKAYDIPMFAVVYNPFFDKDEVICSDTREYLQDWIRCNLPETIWLEMPVLS